MVCIYNPSPDQINAMERYTDVLGSDDAAYYVLSQNNGFPLDKTPAGEDSDLYLDMVNYYGSEEEAIRNKSMLYTERFFDAYGDWTNGSAVNPNMCDAKNEPKLSFVLAPLNDEFLELMNNLFLNDLRFPTKEYDDLSKIEPGDNLSNYAVELLIKMSREEYVLQEHNKFIESNPGATEDEITTNRIQSNRTWYNRKVLSILTEQVKSLCTAFGLKYIQRPNGTIELQSGTYSGFKNLRMKFLSNLLNDPFEEELRKDILDKISMSDEPILNAPGAKDYIIDSIISKRRADNLIAGNSIIYVGLQGGTSTTINKALAFNYISLFYDTPLIQAGLAAVAEDKPMSSSYLVLKLVDIITQPRVVGQLESSYVTDAYKFGVNSELFDTFWNEFDELINQIITKGIKSEKAKHKVLSVVSAAFITNEQYNLAIKPYTFDPSLVLDLFADRYTTKYQPWSKQTEKNLSNLHKFLNLLEGYYQNKVKRQKKDPNIGSARVQETSDLLSTITNADKSNRTEQERLVTDLLKFCYGEIKDALKTISDIKNNSTDVNVDFSKIGTIYGDVIAFYDHIVNVQLGEFFNTNYVEFPRLAPWYNSVVISFNDLVNQYKDTLYNLSVKFCYNYMDKYVDQYLLTDEQFRQMKANIAQELRNLAVYGDIGGWELYVGMNSLTLSGLTRLIHDSLSRINTNVEIDTRRTAMTLEKLLEAAKRSFIHGKLYWKGLIVYPKNFLMVFLERYNDGTPTGLFTRKYHYGNFNKARKEYILELVKLMNRNYQSTFGDIYFKLLLDDEGNPIFPTDNLTYWEKEYEDYKLKLNEYDDIYGHKRFIKEYYDKRVDLLSRDTIRVQADLQNRISILEGSCTRDGELHLEDLPREDLLVLYELYRQYDNLSSKYTLEGNLKQGLDFLIAEELQSFSEFSKDRIMYGTDWEKFNKAKANSKDVANFEKLSTQLDTTEKFREIYQILLKEYRDQFPSYLDSAFEEVARLTKEITDIVNSVKYRRGIVQPILRDLSDGAWAEIKRLEELRDIAYEPIADYKRQHRNLLPSASQVLNEERDVLDNLDDSKTAFDALYDEALALDIQESNATGVVTHQHEHEFLDKCTRMAMVLGHLQRVKLMPFTYLFPSTPPDHVKQRFNLDDTYKGADDMPIRAFSRLLKSNEVQYTKPPLVDDEFDEKENTMIVPKELNPAWDIIQSAPEEVKKLFNLVIETKKKLDNLMDQSPLMAYKMPMIRAKDLQILSRVLQRGLGPTVGRCFTDKFKANETDEEIIDEFTTLPNGERINSVPEKFIRNLEDMTLLTSDVVGAMVLYAHAAYNYAYKQKLSPVYQALLSQIGQDSIMTNKLTELDKPTQHLVLGKTTAQYAKSKNIIDSLLYDQLQLLGERGSLKMSGNQKSMIKSAKTLSIIGTLMALSRNILSQTVGFVDASQKMIAFSFSNEVFNMYDYIYAMATINRYLITGKLITSTGDILPDNFIAALMLKNGLSSNIVQKYLGGYKSKFRRLVGMERSGMGGFRVSDYLINALLSLAIYNNYRLIDTGDGKPLFLSERSFKNKLKRLGYSKKDINKTYDKATTLLEAYGYKNWTDLPFFKYKKGEELTMLPQYADIIGKSELRKLEQNMSIMTKEWAPKLNGAVPESSKAVVQQHALYSFTVGLRSYMINEFHTRFVDGKDFISNTDLSVVLTTLEARRNALVKAYKNYGNDSKIESEILKLLKEKGEVENELIHLASSGDEKVLNRKNILTSVGLVLGEGGIGSWMGSAFGIYGSILGGAIGAAGGGYLAFSNIKSNPLTGGLFISKILKNENRLREIDSKIKTLQNLSGKDKILQEIYQMNDYIHDVKTHLNENKGFYDYARGVFTDGTNRLFGRLLANTYRNAKQFMYSILPQRLQPLKQNGYFKITDAQIRGLKKIAADLIIILSLYLSAQYNISWYRYDDGRGFLGGKFNSIVNPMMKKQTEVLTSAVSPIVNSDIVQTTASALHESSTEGFISHIPFFDKVVENKTDALMGYDKKVSRTTKEISTIKKDPVERLVITIKAFNAVLNLKSATESIAPYDPQTVNDLSNAVSATLNVVAKAVESMQKSGQEVMYSIEEDPMQGGPYQAYFSRLEYGEAHSIYRPFGYPSSYEQTTEIGLVNRMNYLGNTGLNKFLIPKKEPVKKTDKKKGNRSRKRSTKRQNRRKR